ncbi:MAG: zinc finger AN1 domain-containing stress-associated protein [Candidatus Bathyarchaeota archaeon]|nr:zinc finger AN1 domain-containing stress-associated protein [Candidatus Bathyarchaeota archaeon]MDH5689212.1 zinc finger AN1 domain-containing stress-associated protein [Candidatus Bathyarchaeota archaeon]
MSGLIFSLLFAAVSIPALMELLKREFGFREVAEGSGLHGYVDEDGRRVEVFVKRDKKQVQFILPDLSIPDDVCKKVVRKLASKLYAMISEKEISPDDITIVGPSQSFCHYCLEPVGELLFRCWRCGGLYCGKHRFPEEHDCPDGGLMEVAVTSRKKKSEKRKPPSKILLKEAPCG